MHGNLENLEKMSVKQACCTHFMTFEMQAFTVLLLMALLYNYGIWKQKLLVSPSCKFVKKLNRKNWPMLGSTGT